MKDGRLRLVATNGQALSLVEVNCETGHELNYVLSKQNLSVLTRLLADESCKMLYEEIRGQFKSGGRIMSSRTIAGIFPDYERTPLSNILCATVGYDGFAEAIWRACLCVDERSN